MRPPRTTDCSGVISPADPDARYNKHRGTGYLVQIMETFIEDAPAEGAPARPAKPDLITHVAVDPLTMHDKDALAPALDDTAQRGRQPAALLADSHYGSTTCLAQGEQRGVTVVAPVMTAKGARQGKFTLEDFELDDQGCIRRCPAGQEPVETSIAEVRLQAVFDPDVCQNCRHRDRCPAAAVGRTSSRFQYTHDRVHHRTRRLRETGDEFRERYRWRAGVEATMSRFKHQMGMAKLRIRGMANVTCTARLRALGLNILRTATWRKAMASC